MRTQKNIKLLGLLLLTAKLFACQGKLNAPAPLPNAWELFNEPENMTEAWFPQQQDFYAPHYYNNVNKHGYQSTLHRSTLPQTRTPIKTPITIRWC